MNQKQKTSTTFESRRNNQIKKKHTEPTIPHPQREILSPELTRQNYLQTKEKALKNRMRTHKSDIFFQKEPKYSDNKSGLERGIKVQKCKENYEKLTKEKPERFHKKKIEPKPNIITVNGILSTLPHQERHRTPLEKKVIVKKRDTNAPFKMKIYRKYHDSSQVKNSFFDARGDSDNLNNNFNQVDRNTFDINKMNNLKDKNIENERVKVRTTRRNYYNPQPRDDLLDEIPKGIKNLDQQENQQRQNSLHNEQKRLFPDYDENSYKNSFSSLDIRGPDKDLLFVKRRKKNNKFSEIPIEQIKVNRKKNISMDLRRTCTNWGEKLSSHKKIMNLREGNGHKRDNISMDLDSNRGGANEYYKRFDIRDRNFSANKDNITAIFNSPVYSKSKMPKLTNKVNKDNFIDFSEFAKQSNIARDKYLKTGIIQ